VAKSPTDKKDLEDEAFLREVEDAVRESDRQSFLKKWGIWIGASILLFFGSLAGWIYYQNQTEEARGKQGEAYIKAVDNVEAGKPDEAIKQLDAIQANDQAGYRALSILLKANVAAEKGDFKAAASGYETVIKDDSIPKPFRDLALVRKTTLEYDDLKPEDIIARLKPLAKPDNPWFGSAGEMTAIAYMKMGKEDLAGPIFAQISKQEDLPDSLRNRARQMAGVLGVDAIQVEESEDNAESEETKTGSEAK